MLAFNKRYFGLFILIFAIEVFIALFVHDNLVRPYVGDILVVILIYCFIKSFFRLPVMVVAIAVLMFAFMVEFLQYLKIVEELGMERTSAVGIIIGSSFAWLDLVAYIVGVIMVLIIEEKLFSRNQTRTSQA